MRHYLTIPALAIFLAAGCKTEPKKETASDKDLSMLEKISNAHGMDHWNKVTSVSFTFNVDRDTTHFERQWIWKPKTNQVTRISQGDTITYSRKSMDSTETKVDAGFINDKYWFLAPLNIGWDKENVTQEYSGEAEAPISKKEMHKLTVVYGDQGGYTPGDAYDFYFGDDLMIKEWAYRKGNNPEPSSTATWQDYTDKSGLKIARMHKNAEGNFKLYFTNVDVRTD